MNEETAAETASFDWTTIPELLQDKGVDLGIDLGIKIATALAIFFIGKFLIRILVRGISTVMQKQGVDKTLETFISNLVRMSLMVVVVIAAIGAIGIETTSFIAIFGAAGLAIGLALAGSLSNFASGVLIVLFRPYRVGDFIEAAGIAGSVEQVQILTTILKTGDNKSYDDDLDKVRKTLEELLAADDRILPEPAPLIAVSALADSSVNFVVRPWVKSADYWGVMFEMTEAIKKRFDKEGISFPFPQQDVHLYKQD